MPVDQQELVSSKVYKPRTPKNTLELSSDDKSAIRSIAANIKSGDCVLFLGAGANYASAEYEDEYSSSERPPTGSELTQLIRDQLRDKNIFPDENNITLSRVAQYYELLEDMLALKRILVDNIKTDKNPSPILYDLADMPFKYIMTTNYDQLFERALREKKKTPYIGIYKSDRSSKTTNVDEHKISETTPFLYKMHGDIDDEQSIVITDEDYIHFILRMSDKNDLNPIPRAFTDALTKKSILFIGYRLMDYNLRLLFKITRWGKDPNTLPKKLFDRSLT